MFKRAKAAFEAYNGYTFTDEYVQRVIDEDFNGDPAELLACMNREEPSYMDDSWGDYETGDFC